MFLLLVIALVLFLLGFFSAAKFLLLIALVLLLIGLFTGFTGGWGWGYRRGGPPL